MNIQTERLENHTARLTVEIEAERFDQAKKEAARRIAKKVNIPGFRRGKAPYKILVSYVGEASIIEEAVEIIGNQIYPDALKEAKLEPYGPGSLEDFSVDPVPSFKFVLPLEPEINLGDYRSIRFPYSENPVEDTDVDKVFDNLLEQNAVIEESSKPVASGNRVVVDIHATLVEEKAAEDAAEEPAEVEAEAEENPESDEDKPEIDKHFHDDATVLLHRHDAFVTIKEDDADEIAPGFNAALIGAAAGETRQFVVDFPDDADKYQDAAGKQGEFIVTVKKVENMTLPTLNDEFAARVTADEKDENGEAKPLTLLELRMRIRENLQKETVERAKEAYFNQVVDALVEQASIAYPEEMVAEQIESRLQYLDQELRRQKLTLDDYMRILGKTRADVEAEQREPVVRDLERGLVLRQIIEDEKLTVSDADIEAEITRLTEAYGEQAAAMRSLFATPAMRERLHGDLTQRQAVDRVIAIAKGEAPELVVDLPEQVDDQST